ncbi:MAG: phosphatidylserine decarboxylase [Pseudomonadales bacterium]|nr:phosphatidylserine decarboxylase [Pseudomonadales bacterium]
MSSLFVLIQYLLPHHFLSRCVGFFAEGSFLKDFLIRSFIRRYGVDMTEAAISDPTEYPNFNTFFTRELKADARPIATGGNAVVSPADGTINALGTIQRDQILQAKNRNYDLLELLAGDHDLAEEFLDGSFVTVYLSPRDYHRVHMPIAGQLLKTIHVPGRLFSVNKVTTASVPNLFARNERAICVFQTSIGIVCVVLVGAMIVAGIETVWGGQICPSIGPRQIKVSDHSNHEPPIQLISGAEMGRFKLGSTAIVLFPPGTLEIDQNLKADSSIRMGQMLGTLKQSS